jgi:L-asparaginase / beta-aspartyl-peptidase
MPLHGSSNEKSGLLPWRSGSKKYVLIIHGGAGTMSKEGSTPEQQSHYKAALRTALRAGYAVLRDGGEAMDAVTAAVKAMEGLMLSIRTQRLGWNTSIRLPPVQRR